MQIHRAQYRPSSSFSVARFRWCRALIPNPMDEIDRPPTDNYTLLSHIWPDEWYRLVWVKVSFVRPRKTPSPCAAWDFGRFRSSKFRYPNGWIMTLSRCAFTCTTIACSNIYQTVGVESSTYSSLTYFSCFLLFSVSFFLLFFENCRRCAGNVFFTIFCARLFVIHSMNGVV